MALETQSYDIMHMVVAGQDLNLLALLSCRIAIASGVRCWLVDVCPSLRDNCRMMLKPPLRLHMTAESPLGSAVCCFPPASPACAAKPGKQMKPSAGASNSLISLNKFGAGEGIRTLDPNLGKVEGGKTGHVVRLQVRAPGSCD